MTEWLYSIDPVTLIACLIIIATLLIQLILCFKVKSKIIRLLPISVLAVVSAVFTVLCTITTGWDGLAYALYAIFAGILLVICCFSWGIWWIVKRIKAKKIRAKNNVNTEKSGGEHNVG